jgi:hypothetical protein
MLHWALFETAKCAVRRSSPAHDYLEVRHRFGANRATMSVARKLARRCHHTLRASPTGSPEGMSDASSPSHADAIREHHRNDALSRAASPDAITNARSRWLRRRQLAKLPPGHAASMR